MMSAIYYSSVSLLIIQTVICFNSVLVSGTRNATNTCGAYCDTNNNQEQGFICLYSFCCGTDTNKYCCEDASQSHYTLSYDTSCQTWWYLEPWRLLTCVLVAMLIAMVTVIGCFCWRYYGCSCSTVSPFSRRRTAQAGGERGTNDRSDVIDIEHFPNDFDPTSLFAFEPPAYETLPKDPPLYSEVFGGPSSAVGQDNLAYTAHEVEDGATAPLASPFTLDSSAPLGPPQYVPSEIAIIDNIYDNLDNDDTADTHSEITTATQQS